jgi:hypothetical protein
MNSLSGFNSQEMRRLHPYLSALLSRLKALEVKVEAGKEIVWGTNEDIQPTGNENLAGELNKFARADHQHLFKFPTTIPLSTPDGTAFFDLSTSAINIYVGNTPTTKVVAGGTEGDVQPTGKRRTGELPRYSYADHSHLTAILYVEDPQSPVIDEIRYTDDDKLVRWNGAKWQELSVEEIEIERGTNADVQPTRLRSAGSSLRVARADHSHPTAILPQGNTQTPVADEIRYNTSNKLVRWDGSRWVELSVETVGAGTDADVQPTRLRSAGSSARFARADHSHPTAILPQGNAQTPVVDEIRYNTNNKIVRWNGSAWVPLSVETFEIEWGTNDDIQPTRLQSAGTATRFARADHSHPTAILSENDPQPPVEDEIRYNTDNKIVRWDGGAWVPLSVEAGGAEAGTEDDVQPTGLKSAGTTTRYARADHSHPTALLPMTNSQTPVENELRYKGTNQLVRRIGNSWVDIATSSLPIPANPLVLPFDDEVSSPLSRQLFNHSFWDDIGNATVFYYDSDNDQPRLVFARPLVVATSSTPSEKNVWSTKTNELVLKHNPMDINGASGVLWSRGGNSGVWSPVATQLTDSNTTILPTDVGVLARSASTGTTGSRRWFLRGAQEDGFRAPFAGIATFTSATTPSPADLSTTLGDGYAYFVHDVDRIDVVKPTTNGNKHPMMLTHSIITPICRTFITTTDPSGHYVRDEQWNSIWVVAFRTTTSATTNLIAVLPTITVPFGIQEGRVLLYLHNPQSAVITTVFALLVRTPTYTGIQDTSTLDVSVVIPANRTVVADLGHLSFPASTTLSHHRSFPITPIIIRRRASETANAYTVFCLAVAIVPQHEA